MLLPIILCPIVCRVLLLGSKISNSYKHKYRMRQCAITSICEWPFTFILFNSYNIYVSLTVDAQSLGLKDPMTMVPAAFSGLLPITIGILYFLFRVHYK